MQPTMLRACHWTTVNRVGSLKSVVGVIRLGIALWQAGKRGWGGAHRPGQDAGLFTGPVEVDATYTGGKRKNMPRSKRKSQKGRGHVGKTAIAGAKDRETHAVSARVVDATLAARNTSRICLPPAGSKSEPGRGHLARKL